MNSFIFSFCFLSNSKTGGFLHEKLFVCLLALILLCSVSMTAFAACPSHGTLYEKYEGTTYSGSWYSISDTTHRQNGIIYYSCTYCAALLPKTEWTDTTYRDQVHSFTFFDLGHAGTAKLHNWRKVCGVCSYSKNGQYTCSGNPCITIQSIPQQELQ